MYLSVQSSGYWFKKYEITTIDLKTTNPYLPDRVEFKHQFSTKNFINTKVRKMLILAIGKNLQWERIEFTVLDTNLCKKSMWFASYLMFSQGSLSTDFE